jgi:hypothetical protein
MVAVGKSFILYAAQLKRDPLRGPIRSWSYPWRERQYTR